MAYLSRCFLSARVWWFNHHFSRDIRIIYCFNAHHCWLIYCYIIYSWVVHLRVISWNQALLDISLKFNPHVWCLETFLSKSQNLSRRLHQNPNPTIYVFPIFPICSRIFLYISSNDSFLQYMMSRSCSNIFMFSNHVFLMFHHLQPTSPKLSPAPAAVGP